MAIEIPCIWNFLLPNYPANCPSRCPLHKKNLTDLENLAAELKSTYPNITFLALARVLLDPQKEAATLRRNIQDPELASLSATVLEVFANQQSSHRLVTFHGQRKHCTRSHE